MTTKITFENENGRYIVEVSETEMSVPEVCDMLIKPVLLSAKYDINSINEHIIVEEE